jgi:RNA polymerase subunit RPABC4/transcription elongation factor Spt4
MPEIPTELFNQIGVVLETVVAILTGTLVAFWVGLAIWALRDIRARTRDIFAWVLATLLVLVTGPIGALLYMLLRPRETLAQVYDRQLEEEALLRDITSRRACPTCQTVTEPDWVVCPRCRTELRQRCSVCQKPLEMDWTACPYCGAETVPVAPVYEPRSESRSQVSALPPRRRRAAVSRSAQRDDEVTASSAEYDSEYSSEYGSEYGGTNAA